MNEKTERVCRMRDLFSEKVEREDANFALLDQQFKMGSANVLIRFWQGKITLPVQSVPEVARYLGVDPAWLLRIYLEDHLPATLATIDGACATMLLTQHERNLVLAYRQIAATQHPPQKLPEAGQWSSMIGVGAGPPPFK